MTVRHSELWPPEREAELIRRFEAGEQSKAIARAFGLLPEQVTWRIVRLQKRGLLGRRTMAWDRADYAEVLTLAERMSAGAIGRQLGITRDAAYQALRRARQLAAAEGLQLPLALNDGAPLALRRAA